MCVCVHGVFWFCGAVLFSANAAPTGISLSNATYTAPATANATVGALSTTDANSGQTFTYTIVGGANALLFNISGALLRVTNAGQTGSGLVVTVRSTDSGTGSLFFEQTFTINDGACGFWHTTSQCERRRQRERIKSGMECV